MKRQIVIASLFLAIILTCLVIFLNTEEHDYYTEVSFEDQGINYQGMVRNNKFEGEGKLTFSNGDDYQGAFVDGRFEGEEVFIQHQGWDYVGSFSKGTFNGEGVLTTEDGKIFAGRFENGAFEVDEN